MMEDTCLHENLSFLVWIMAATSKGWKLTRDQVLLILKSVYLMASCNYRDPIPASNEILSSLDPFSNPLFLSSSTSSRVQIQISRSDLSNRNVGSFSFLTPVTTVTKHNTTTTTTIANATETINSTTEVKIETTSFGTASNSSPSLKGTRITDPSIQSSTAEVVPKSPLPPLPPPPTQSMHSPPPPPIPTTTKSVQSPHPPSLSKTTESEISNLSKEQKNFVFNVVGSLLIRINYGGMKGDQSMLIKFSLSWFTRLTTNYSLWSRLICHWYHQGSI
eukprot:TRINITY_DN7691_c0_g5_i2.p1 TRINITY_DN7691_c0_g5~~TRINITY_DN7691_c0_g5_i2.p1  ORF type:complete len:276 (+),score=48.81 TRINITY_DN7691_c0_g5_i2:584-1411(+)